MCGGVDVSGGGGCTCVHVLTIHSLVMCNKTLHFRHTMCCCFHTGSFVHCIYYTTSEATYPRCSSNMAYGDRLISTYLAGVAITSIAFSLCM